MQDALFFFFGILALWLLLYQESTKGLLLAALCLFLSMLSKESAVIWIVICLAYLLLFDRARFRVFLGILVLPIVAYLALKIHAVGLDSKQHGAPIDNVSFIGRMFTVPSIALFYVGKLLFPWKLATGYYWTNPTFSVRHVLVPALIDTGIVGLFVYAGILVRKRSKTNITPYLFFLAWLIVGIGPYLQIIPLDLTACDTWFYVSMAGLLGLFGVVLQTFKVHRHSAWLIIAAAVVVPLLGIRSAIRGTDYRSQYNLAVRDVRVMPGDYAAMNNIAQGLIDMGKYKQAVTYAKQSASIYPTVSNYDNLGVALQQSGDHTGAVTAYNTALQYGSLNIIYENLGQIALEYGDAVSGLKLFQKALKAYPQDYKLWIYLAILKGEQSDNNGGQSRDCQCCQVRARASSSVLQDHV